MNALVERLNDIAAAWWTIVLYASWQSALVAAVVLGFVLLLHRLPSPLRYGLVLVAMVKFLAPPFFAMPFGALSQMSVTRVDNQPITTPDAAVRPDGPPLAHPLDYALPFNRTTADVDRNAGPAAAGGEEIGSSETLATSSAPADIAAGAARPPLPLRRPRITWRAVLMLLHAVGVILTAGWVLMQFFYIRALLGSACQIDDGPLDEVFRGLVGEMRVRRRVRLMVSSELIAPMAVGVVRPAVVMPSSLAERFSADEQRTILAHELAHHRRFDLPVLWLQAVMLSLWWFHPMAWVVHRVLLRLREECCDDLVLDRRVTTARDYSSALLRAVEWGTLQTVRRDLGWFASPMHPLGRRLERVLDTSLRRRSRLSAFGLIGVALAACALLPGMTRERARGGDGASEASALQGLPALAADAPPGEGFDLYADPLPAGAVARLGTLRYRPGVSGVTSVAFLPDSKTVCSRGRRMAGGSGSLRTWDVATGKTLSGLDVEDAWVAAFDPLPDGKNIAVLEGQGFNPQNRELTYTLGLWNAETGERRMLANWVDELPTWPGALVAATQDGATVAVHAAPRKVRLFNLKSGDVLTEHTFETQQITALDFSADGGRLALATTHGVYLWRWRAQEIPPRILDRGAQAVAFSPDAKLLAVRASGGSVLLWDTISNRLVPGFRDRTADPQGETISFLPDGKHLVVPQYKTRQIEILDAASGKRVRSFDGAGEVFDLALSLDGRYLATAEGYAVIKVWDLETGRLLNERAPGHDSAPRAIRFTSDGTRVVTGVNNELTGTIRIWDAKSGKQLRTLRHDQRVTAMAVSPDGRRVASCSFDGVVRVWDAESGELAFKQRGHGPRVADGGFEAVFTLDSKQLITFGNDLNLRTWDARNGRLIAQHTIHPRKLKYQAGKDGQVRAAKFQLSHYDKIATRDAVTHVQFSADRQSLLFTSWPIGGFPPGLKTSHEVAIASGAGVDQYRVDDDLTEVAVSSRGDRIATVERRFAPAAVQREAVKLGVDSTRYFVRLRDAITKDVVRTIELPGIGQHCVFSPNGGRIALSMSQRTGPDQMKRWIAVWDTASGEEVARVEGYAGEPFALAFSPDGHRLASSHEDSTVLIWDLDQFLIKR